MAATHHREGEKALLIYDVSKAPELSNPLDPSSAPTGNSCFILAELYQSDAGVADHFQKAEASWDDFDDAGGLELVVAIARAEGIINGARTP